MKKFGQISASLVVGLLVVIAVAMVVFVCYYIFHAQKSTSKTYSSASAVLQSSPAKAQKYFTIKEWGIRAPYSGNLDLEYTIHAGTPTYAYLSSSELDASDAQCKDPAFNGGVISRYLSTDKVQDEDGHSSSYTPAKYISVYGLSSDQYDQIGYYYYFYAQPQGECGSSSASHDLQTKTASAFQSLFSEFKGYN